MSTSPHRLVCFDLGNVVIRICRRWEEACIAAGVSHAPNGLPPERSGARHELVMQHELGTLTCEEFFMRYAAETGRHTAVEVRAVHDAWLLGEFPGMQELIHECSAAGFRTACLSNTNARHWAQLKGVGAGWSRSFAAFQAIEIRAASHLYGDRKPSSSIYARFEEEARVRPEEILFFDDLEANVEAARRRGWQAVLVGQTDDRAAEIAPHLCL